MLSKLRPNKSNDQVGAARVPALVDVSQTLTALLQQQGEFESRQKSLRQELDKSLQAQAREKAARISDLIAGTPRPSHRDPSTIATEIKDVGAAIEELGRRIVHARVEASAKIREIVAPEHKRLVREMVVAMVQLHTSFKEYQKFTDTLNAKGIAWSQLHPMMPHFVGEPDSKFSAMADWLREAAAAGFVSVRELPEVCR